ncbi:MAG: carboxypeptidase regulatory-like domain-containing protein, partial [Gemmatimonadota bacterium]
MKQLWLLVAGALLVMPTVVRSQTINGVVLEDSSRLPISGATVQLLTVSRRLAAVTVTESNGGFLLRVPAPGKFVVQLLHPSYAALESDTFAVGAGEIVGIELRMGRVAIALAPLVVQARSDPHLGGFYERMARGGGAGRFLTRKDIETRALDRATDVVRGTAGVQVVTARRGRISGQPAQMITMNGPFGPCLPNVVVDGMPFRQLPEGGLDDVLKPEMLEGVE